MRDRVRLSERSTFDEEQEDESSTGMYIRVLLGKQALYR